MSHSSRARSRVYLRHQRRRIIARRAQVVSYWGEDQSRADVIRKWWNLILRSADTPCRCNCWACKNARNGGGRQSPQEDMAEIRELEQLLALGLAHMKSSSRSAPSFPLNRQLRRIAQFFDNERSD